MREFGGRCRCCDSDAVAPSRYLEVDGLGTKRVSPCFFRCGGSPVVAIFYGKLEYVSSIRQVTCSLHLCTPIRCGVGEIGWNPLGVAPLRGPRVQREDAWQGRRGRWFALMIAPPTILNTGSISLNTGPARGNRPGAGHMR